MKITAQEKQLILKRRQVKANDSSIGNIADEITRLIIGDRNVALKRLPKVITKLETKGLASLEPEKYNELYQNLYTNIHKAIKNTLNSI